MRFKKKISETCFLQETVHIRTETAFREPDARWFFSKKLPEMRNSQLYLGLYCCGFRH
jgi:hypothetical protein